MEVRDPDSKKDVLVELLDQGMVLVTLDARAEGVDVPRHLREDAQLRLNLSYRFGLPMELDEAGVRATLTFAGSAYPCRLPWRALYLFVSHVTGRPVLFPGDVPPEFAGAGLQYVMQPSARRAAGRPRIKLVSGAGTESTVPESDEPSPKTPPRRGHLRVVK